MNNDAITAYQVRAADQSTYNAQRLERWGAATTKGVIPLPNGGGYTPSQDTLVIGAIVVGGVVWYWYRRRIASTIKKVENVA